MYIVYTFVFMSNKIVSYLILSYLILSYALGLSYIDYNRIHTCIILENSFKNWNAYK